MARISPPGPSCAAGAETV